MLSGTSYSNDAPKLDLEQWHVGVAIGVGQITNPLAGGDDIPLIVIPDVAYYDEQFYFDNGQLGFTLHESNKHVLSIISEVNPENRFFVSWHPANQFISLNSSESANDKVQSIDISDIKKPDWSLDLGINYQYITQQYAFSLNMLQDISAVHNGHRASINFKKHWQVGTFRYFAGIGADYISSELAHYYYGIDKRHSLSFTYQQKSAWIGKISLDIQKPLSEQLDLIMKLAYQDMSTLDDSPLFEKSSSTTLFLGVGYVF